MKTKQTNRNAPRNLVAKHMNTANRSSVEIDRKAQSKLGESKHKTKYF
jgi:hypothetical protein